MGSKHYTKEEDDYIRAAIADGCSVREIANELGRNQNAMYNHMRVAGIKLNTVEPREGVNEQLCIIRTQLQIIMDRLDALQVSDQ